MHFPTEKTCWAYEEGLLSPRKTRRVAAHLTHCALCSRRVNDYRSIKNAAIETAAPRLNSADLLGERNTLIARLKQPGLTSRSPRRSGIQSRALQPVLIFSVFALGLLSGWGLHLRSHTPQRLTLDAIKMATQPLGDVEVIATSGRAGEIELRYSSLEKRSLKGRLETEAIQCALAVSLLSEPRVNIRLKHIDLLRPSTENRVVLEALAEMAQHDENPGVRMKALQHLAPLFQDSAVRQTVIHLFLNDPVQGIRVQAANVLRSAPDAEIIKLLKEQAGKDAYSKALLLTAACPVPRTSV